MKVYKLRHIPTGLFYQPSKGNGNLSLKGKIYQNRPPWEYGGSLRLIVRSVYKSKIDDIICKYFGIEPGEYSDTYHKTKESDWEIIEL